MRFCMYGTEDQGKTMTLSACFTSECVYVSMIVHDLYVLYLSSLVSINLIANVSVGMKMT